MKQRPADACAPGGRSRRWLVFLVASLAVGAVQAGHPISDAWLSPRNRERARRSRTEFIILHTTEGGSSGALEKVRRNGEAHYLVDERGRIFRIVDRRRIAYHCGRSMWNGQTQLDQVSLGIEVAGYHNRELREAQIIALTWLVGELQRIYRIPDDRVMPHSMVAYGAPNRWHPQNHRGRKRCGMQFARDDIRRRLGLTRRPSSDPDVHAGRLVHADPVLAQALFAPARSGAADTPPANGNGSLITARRTAWDIAREAYNSGETRYIFPDGTERRGDEIRNWRSLPAGTRVVVGGSDDWENREGFPRILGRDGDTPLALAGVEWNRPGTLYLDPDGRLLPGDGLSEEEARTLPMGTRVWIGYQAGEPVTARRRAFDICGPRWNAPDTFYLLPCGTIHAGDQIEERRIPVGTRILLRSEAVAAQP